MSASTRAIVHIARIRNGDRLHKSAGKVSKSLVLDPKVKPKIPDAVGQPRPGDYLRVQRPGLHQAPILAKLVGSGQHGVTVEDQTGKQIRVRHEHVLEHHPQPAPKERAGFARALHAQGVPMPVQERFLKLDAHGIAARRPTAEQLANVEQLTAYGIPLDVAAITEDASYEDVRALLAQYIDDPLND